MLSETLYKRMMIDKELTSSMKKASAVELEHSVRSASDNRFEPAVLSTAYYNYHKSAFELSLLFSPRAARIPTFTGDFLLTVMSIAKLGRHHISNLKEMIGNSDIRRSGVKRLDKIMLNFNQMLMQFAWLEAEVQESIDAYVSMGKVPSQEKISTYSKSLLRVRRSYFRVQSKLKDLEKHIDHSAYAYKPYGPLLMLAHLHTGTPPKGLANSRSETCTVYTSLDENKDYLKAVYNYDSARSKQKNKKYIDIAKTVFISNCKLPRDAIVKHMRTLSGITSSRQPVPSPKAASTTN